MIYFFHKSLCHLTPALREKCPNTEFFSGPYSPVFGLSSEFYAVNLRIQSKHGDIILNRTNTSIFLYCVNLLKSASL